MSRLASTQTYGPGLWRTILSDQLCVTEEEFWALQKPLIPGVFESDDAKEGPRSFAEKRAPVWSGR